MLKAIKWDLKGLDMLSGDKVILRYPKLSDVNTIKKEINKPEIMGNIKLPPVVKVTLKKEEEWIKKQPKLRRNNVEIHWVILDKVTKEFVGVGGFNEHTKSKYCLGFAGMWITKKNWGKGHSRDALAILLKIGFTKLKFNKIQTDVLSYNIRSRKHLENEGFYLEGIQREKYTLGSKKIDDYHFGMTKSDWIKKSKKK